MRYYLNRLIRRANFSKTAEEVEALLHATKEDYMSVRAKAVGISWNEMRQLLRNLPEFRLSRMQIIQRQIMRLHQAREPLYSARYMHALHGNLYERARQQFGSCWIALRSVGINARPMWGGNKPRLREAAGTLTPLQEKLLRLRLDGASYNRIASVHSLTVPQVYVHFDRIAAKIPRDTKLMRQLDKLDRSEAQIRNLEQRASATREDVFDSFMEGKPVYRIRRETGLTENAILAHMFSFTRAEKRRILEAARKREKAVAIFEKFAQRAKTRQPMRKVAG